METATVALLISVVSLLVAGLSLIWQVAEWRLSAARPEATLLHGLVVEEARVFGGEVGRTGEGFDVGEFWRHGITGPEVIGIKVTNHGRASLTVERVSVRARGGTLALDELDQVIGEEPLPHTIEPGTNASWYMPLARAKVRLTLSSAEVLNQAVTGIYMTAQLGTGKTIETDRSLSA